MRSFLLAGAALVATALARNLPHRSISSLATRQNGGLPSSFSWTSSGILVSPKKDSRNIAGIKDPSIIEYEGVYHVFASTAVESGYNLVYFNFTDFDQAQQAPFYYLDQSAIGTGYRAAPEKLWYLIYQNGNAAYSTNPDISNPAGWTAPEVFYPNGTPALIAEGLLNPQQGYWVDMWVVCDDANCHLFSHDDNGRLYRSQTPLSQFPAGMSEPVIALSEPNKNDLFEASNVYRVDNNTYLLLVECIGAGDSPGGLRYFRSWTSSSLSGSWTPLAATQQNPFMGEANVAFPDGRWSDSISHGEIVRSQVDQTLTIKPCGMRFLYQGIAPNASGTYNALPWHLGLVTQTGNTTC
ncbi:alpha-L-arab-like proteininofuranosidase precursor [Alternaria alternata]|nr:alpha-L-arab-like proteininofuranosidase precursor [Alternaria alternata]